MLIIGISFIDILQQLDLIKTLVKVVLVVLQAACVVKHLLIAQALNVLL